MSERLIGRKDGSIGWVIFNNPERRNAVSLDMWQAIPEVLASFGSDPEVRTVVLTGAGDKAFVSGADISQFESTRSSAEQVQHYEEVAEKANHALKTCDKPAAWVSRRYATCASRPTTRVSASRRRRWASAIAPRR
jgi:enoyl-CoA hydratase/carnithine racemase